MSDKTSTGAGVRCAICAQLILVDQISGRDKHGQLVHTSCWAQRDVRRSHPMDREESWDAPQDPGHTRAMRWGGVK